MYIGTLIVQFIDDNEYSYSLYDEDYKWTKSDYKTWTEKGHELLKKLRENYSLVPSIDTLLVAAKGVRHLPEVKSITVKF